MSTHRIISRCVNSLLNTAADPQSYVADSAARNPPFLNSSTPQLPNSSTPQLLNSPTPQLPNSPTPQLPNTGPRFRKVFTLYGPADDLPGLVSAYVDAILAHKTSRTGPPEAGH